MTMHRALNGDALTLGLLRLLQGTSAGANIVINEPDATEEVVHDRAVDPYQGSGNVAPRYTQEDALLEQLCNLTGAINPRGRWT